MSEQQEDTYVVDGGSLRIAVFFLMLSVIALGLGTCQLRERVADLEEAIKSPAYEEQE